MFPFQQNNDLSSDISYDPNQDNDIIDQEIPFLYEASPQTTNLTSIMGEGHQADMLANSNTNNDVNFTGHERRITRREIEQQRRRQMSTLHGSLRNLLPLQSIKGKRSMSDHIDAAAKYIKNLENNIQELSIKRDKLKNLPNSSFLDEQGRNYENSDSDLKNTTVIVRSHLSGVEIIISCGSKEESSCLSNVLEALVEEGFDILSCISTRRDEILYNTILCQASHLTCIDLATLQQKLNDVILSS